MTCLQKAEATQRCVVDEDTRRLLAAAECLHWLDCPRVSTTKSRQV